MGNIIKTTQLPANLVRYGNTPRFTAQTLPDALQKWHRTKEAVWAKIILTSGTALYEIMTEPPESLQLSPGIDGIIEPQQPHRVTPSEDVELQIFFYQKAAIQESRQP